MKTQRLWARAFQTAVVLWLFAFAGQVSAAKPAGAQIDLPSSEAAGKFHQWRKMHASSYEGTIDSALSQCYNSVFSATWLNSSKCQLFGDMLEKGLCMEVMVKDGIRLDILNGRVNGDPKGESKAWPNQEKATGRLDLAKWCDLGDGVHAIWFTGVIRQSCNNVGFVYKPLPKPVETQTIYYAPPQTMQHTGVVRSDDVMYVPGVNLNNCCNNCNQSIPDIFTIIRDGDGLQSSGSSVVDW